jgi:serine/threonine protein kinase/predicted hydrocarbon binding protein
MRGLCSEEEVDILIKWVNDEQDSSGWHSLAAAKALCALIRRPDTEFTIPSRQLCERITSKTNGCLTRLLELGVRGLLDVHNEIPRSELKFGDKIGDGTAGTVYRGKWGDKNVAIKVFHQNTHSEINETEFRKELALLSLIQHPLVLTCYGGSTKKGDYFIVTELMEASVYDLLHDTNFNMDLDLKLDIAIATAKCMNFLHSCGLIHRDLKSLNLLVSKDFDVKICDFGLSRFIDRQNQMTNNIGTVSWTAPEIFQKKFYSEKADVYSFGIILWELLTRQTPYEHVEAFSIPLLVSKGERPEIPKDAPNDWRKLIKACWHQKPSSRPTFKKILQKLREMRENLRRRRLQEGIDIDASKKRTLQRNTTTNDESSSNNSQNSTAASTGTPYSSNTTDSARSSEENFSDGDLDSTSLHSSSSANFTLRGSLPRKISLSYSGPNKRIIKVPDTISDYYQKVEREVKQTFQHFQQDPNNGTLRASNERFLLFQAHALSIDLFTFVKQNFPFQNKNETVEFFCNLTFEIGKAFGSANIKEAEEKIRIDGAIELLSMVSVRLAFEGWALAEILPQSNLTNSADVFLLWDHHYSFEANVWHKYYRGDENDVVSSALNATGTIATSFPVCCMTCGYYSGWCERALGFPVLAAEIMCKAKGDPVCRFVLSSPQNIENYLKNYLQRNPHNLTPAEMQRVSLPTYVKQRLQQSPNSPPSNWFIQSLRTLWSSDISLEHQSHGGGKKRGKSATEKDIKSVPSDSASVTKFSPKSPGKNRRQTVFTDRSDIDVARSKTGESSESDSLQQKAQDDNSDQRIQLQSSAGEGKDRSVLMRRKYSATDVSFKGSSNIVIPKSPAKKTPTGSRQLRRIPSPQDIWKIRIVQKQSSRERLQLLVPEIIERELLKKYQNLKFQLEKGCIEINDECFVLAKAKTATQQMFFTIQHLIDEVNGKMSADFAANFLYEMARVWGHNEAKRLFNELKKEAKNLREFHDPFKRKGLFLVEMSLRGWGNGHFFSCRINENDKVNVTTDNSPERISMPSSAEDKSSTQTPPKTDKEVKEETESQIIIDNYFMLGVALRHSFEAWSWHRKRMDGSKEDEKIRRMARCYLSAGYMAGWLEANFEKPLVAIEIACATEGNEVCDFIIANPQYIEMYVNHFRSSSHSQFSSTLETLAKSHQFGKASDNTKGSASNHWIKNFFARKETTEDADVQNKGIPGDNKK